MVGDGEVLGDRHPVEEGEQEAEVYVQVGQEPCGLV